MNVTIYGSGYVGLVVGACLADAGHTVLCADVDEAKINTLQEGRLPIYEPGLESIMHNAVRMNRLAFTTDMARAVSHARVQFIAVGTPPSEDGSADLSHVLSVARTIAEKMNGPKIIVNKSTVPVGTGDKMETLIGGILEKRGKNIPFRVVSNPEFLKEGAAVEDFMRPDRIIIGTEDAEATEIMKELYAPFSRNHNKILVMDRLSAELTKYAANAMLATKIGFMNEMARLAERVGADIEKVRLGIGSDRRIGYHFIYPGCGYGGSCFPKDIRAIIRTARDAGMSLQILQAVEECNERQKHLLFEKITKRFGKDLKGRTFALWGLAFKPGTDDMREAPSRVLMEALWKAGAKIRAFDPVAMDACRRLYGQRDDLILCPTPEDALSGADALVIVTEWKAFRGMAPETFRKHLRAPLVFDGRNLYDPAKMQAAGVEYYPTGRPAALLPEAVDG